MFLLRLFTAITILLGIQINAYSQFNGIDILGDEVKREIPFEFIGGFIVVEVLYGDILQMNFILDTGASHNILFKKTANDLLGYKYTDTIKIGGANMDVQFEALVTRGVSLKLKNTKSVKRDVIVIKDNTLDLENILGKRIDGIIGGDFFKGLIVDLNFKKEKLVLHNPNTFVPNKKFTKHAIQVLNHKPYLSALISIDGQSDSLMFLLDTGASLTLLVHSNKKDKINVPMNTIAGSIGNGISGELYGFIGMINNITFQDYHFNNIISSFQEIDSLLLLNEAVHRDGIIGNLILSRFHVVIDYMREILYLKPITNLEKEFKFDKSGMRIYAFGINLDEYFIKNVYLNTPASEAGILPGDRIIKIGFWPLRFCSLEEIIQRLQEEEGKTVKMTILRNGKKIKKKFKLRNFYKD